jgi:hypothetical protein
LRAVQSQLERVIVWFRLPFVVVGGVGLLLLWLVAENLICSLLLYDYISWQVGSLSFHRPWGLGAHRGSSL